MLLGVTHLTLTQEEAEGDKLQAKRKKLLRCHFLIIKRPKQSWILHKCLRSQIPGFSGVGGQQRDSLQHNYMLPTLSFIILSSQHFQYISLVCSFYLPFSSLLSPSTRSSFLFLCPCENRRLVASLNHQIIGPPCLRYPS